jgi:hypothetical protein
MRRDIGQRAEPSRPLSALAVYFPRRCGRFGESFLRCGVSIALQELAADALDELLDDATSDRAAQAGPARLRIADASLPAATAKSPRTGAERIAANSREKPERK